MKKIAFIVAVPDTAHSFLADHIAVLQRYYEVHLIANFPEGYDGSFWFRDVIYHHVPIHRKISIWNDFKALFALCRVFRKEKFDCVHSVTPKAGLLTALAGWMTRIINRVHIFTGQVWATRKGVMRTMLKSMDKVIALLDTVILVDGEGQRQFLIRERVLKESNSFVPAEGSIAGIKLERFVINGDVRKEERQHLGITNDKVVFIFLGRLNHDKGIGELFEAFNQLILECPESILLFYGTDEEAYDKRADQYPNIRRGVNYLYQGPTKTPYNALQAGDVFVLPTWREGFGVSVLEAQALGLPVITSDAYGVVDASIDGVTGLRCHVNDPEGLYRAMRQYYINPELRKIHGAAGRKRVEEHFSNEVVSGAWLEIYKEMLG